MTFGLLDRLRPRRDQDFPLMVEGLSQARAYWEGLRKDRGLPLRQSIDPRGLAGILDRVFLADRIGRGVAQVRIAGSGLADFAGLDIRGLPLGCLFAATSRAALAERIERVFMEPAVVELDLGSDRGPGGLVARLLLLPLDDDAGGRMVLGVMGFAEACPARCRLDLRSCREERLVMPTLSPGCPEPLVQPIRRLGHLALVHSSD